ncbi:MAG: hypothetical protein ACM3NV_11170 [Syntrophothermus sp.]
MKSIAANGGRTSSRGRAALAAVVAVAALLLPALPAAAAAEELPASALGPEMRLGFAGHSARMVGSHVLLSVRCRGPLSGTCAGTVSLGSGGAGRTVPFSIAGGRAQGLLVPFGERGNHAPARVRAVARTMQPLGAFRETERLLRLR